MSSTDAKINPIPEMSNYELWQESRYGNILSMPETNTKGEVFESGADELNRLAEWINQQSEQQRHETEREFWYKSF